MRHIITIFVTVPVLISAQAQEKAPPMDALNMYVINQSAISHSRPVSFSVAYPQDWHVSEAGRPQASELLVNDDELVCRFSPVPEVPIAFSTRLEQKADIMIWRSTTATPKEEADWFARHLPSTYKRQLYSSVVTKVGDRGYLVICEANLGREPELFSHLVFHHGRKGAIRISIRTKAVDTRLFQELNNLVLQTLEFPND